MLTLKSSEVDAYIREAAEFARPILKHLRKVVHQHYPKARETIKWGCPHFVTTEDKLLCAMVAFKAHCRFGFWKGAAMIREHGARAERIIDRLEHIEDIKDLPNDKDLAFCILEAARLLEKGSNPVRRSPKPSLAMPVYFTRALKVNKKAWTHYEAFSPSAKRDYIEWIVGAKGDDTRERRLETAVEWIAQGKKRNWKYER